MNTKVEVNRKRYSLWQQFVDKKNEWIGGTLRDMQDGTEAVEMITDIRLKPNGADSAFFEIVGESFSSGFDVHVGGISGRQPNSGWLRFSGYGGHEFEIRKAQTL